MARQVLRYALEPVEPVSEGEEVFDPDANSGSYLKVEIPKSSVRIGRFRFGSRGMLIYVIGDPDEAETRELSFYVTGNGRNLPDDVSELGYVDTLKMGPGSPTWHVFEVEKVAA